ncbi:MAG: release factor glutamine methyltransferase [Thermoleophilaceae bacterium]|jgi:release factor glutamine methyltransferase|nr:release factor glutamine methyltransferase [Thermoleophilaceae bacterium]
MSPADEPRTEVVERLRAAGSVFAEDEARLLGDDEALIARRIAGERIEHVLGWTEFCGLRIEIDPGVFVPRPQTEALAEHAARLAPAIALDLFAGSGAIACVVKARNPSARVVAAELDAAALECARRNTDHYGVELVTADVDDGVPPELAGKVDLITANVPYVPSGELPFVPHDGEPDSALHGGPDGERWIRRVIEIAPRWLTAGGVVLFEGPEGERVREWHPG